MRRAQMETGGKGLSARESADSAAAAGSGATDNIHNKARLDAAKAADAAAAARIQAGSNLRGASSANPNANPSANPNANPAAQIK